MEDQQKINRFARLNNRLEELRDEAKARQAEMQTLDDAAGDLLLIEDDDERVAYQVGEVFLYLSQDEAQSAVEERKHSLQAEVKSIDEKMGAIRGQMSDLKTQLYGKFGSAINLEADEE